MRPGLPTRAPAAHGSGNPPCAQRPTHHRSRSPAPPSPGAGTPAAAACPRAVRDGATRCRATAGRDKQQRTRRRPGCASFPAAAETRPEPKESLAERGVAPRGRRGRVPAQGVRPFPRECAPHRRGTDRALLQMLSYLGLVARRVAGPQEKREPNEGLLATTGLTEPYLGAPERCPSLLIQWGEICLKRLQGCAPHTGASPTAVGSRLTVRPKVCFKTRTPKLPKGAGSPESKDGHVIGTSLSKQETKYI